MLLRTIRDVLTDHSSIGKFHINDDWSCECLEDKTRSGAKIPGSTAIPVGEYDVTIDFSEKFGKRMIHILNVPDYIGVRIHRGNTDKNTLGCILVGMLRARDWVGYCQPAYEYIFFAVDAALKAGEEVKIRVSISENVVDKRTTT